MLLWSIFYYWCLYFLQDTGGRWRQLWRDKHCSTTISKPIFSLLIQPCCKTNLQLRSKRKKDWEEKFWMPADIWAPQKRAGKRGFRTGTVTGVIFFGDQCFWECARIWLVLCVLLVLSSLNPQNSSYCLNAITTGNHCLLPYGRTTIPCATTRLVELDGWSWAS
jgi:hypothetical protein